LQGLTVPSVPITFHSDQLRQNPRCVACSGYGARPR